MNDNKQEPLVPEEHIHDEHESCSALLASLGDYVDGTLRAELCAELERHMKGCQRCTVVVNTLKKTVELYQESAEETEVPAEVKQRLYLRLKLDDYLK